MTNQQINKMLNDINNFTSSYSKMLDEGKIAPLDEFERKVKQLCNLIALAPETEAKLYEDALQEILNKLLHWSELMKNFQENLRANIHEINVQTKGTNAYDQQIKWQNTNDNHSES